MQEEFEFEFDNRVEFSPLETMEHSSSFPLAKTTPQSKTHPSLVNKHSTNLRYRDNQTSHFSSLHRNTRNSFGRSRSYGTPRNNGTNPNNSSQTKNKEFDNNTQNKKEEEKKLIEPICHVEEKINDYEDDFDYDSGEDDFVEEYRFTNPTTTKSPKKHQISLNHLLNFVYEFPSEDEIQPRRQYKKRYHIPFKRERFLQANCQFLVSPKPNGDYSSNVGDADSAIDWNCVEEVIFPMTVEYECVICLYPPIAPQITKCGHIFCFGCIIRYILQDHFSRRAHLPCPVCQETICIDDLRTVHLRRVSNYALQSTIEFVKLKRFKDSNIIQLVTDEINSDPNKKSSLSEDEKFYQGLPVCTSRHAPFNRILLTFDSEHVQQKEEQQLLEQFRLAVSSGENDQLPYLEAAHQIAQERTVKYKARKNLQNLTQQTDKSPNTSSSPNTPSFTTNTNTTNNNKDAFYFYQEQNGQQIYIHPLNAKWLLKEYGSFDRFPTRLSGSVIDMEDWTQTEMVRKRYKYLGHLPLSCNFKFCLIELTEKNLSPQHLSGFREDVRRRQEKIERSLQEQIRLLKQKELQLAKRKNNQFSSDITTFFQSDTFHETHNLSENRQTIDLSTHNFPTIQSTTTGINSTNDFNTEQQQQQHSNTNNNNNQKEDQQGVEPAKTSQSPSRAPTFLEVLQDLAKPSMNEHKSKKDRSQGKGGRRQRKIMLVLGTTSN